MRGARAYGILHGGGYDLGRFEGSDADGEIKIGDLNAADWNWSLCKCFLTTFSTFLLSVELSRGHTASLLSCIR